MSNAASILSRFIYIGVLTLIYSHNIYGEFDDNLVRDEKLEQGTGAYRNGDYESAVKIFLDAAERGDPRAMYAMGSMYAGGTGVILDYKKAYEWLDKAAKNNRWDAQYKTGLMHTLGMGVTQNYKKAVMIHDKLAQMDYPPAQYRLGLLYAQGKGVEKNNIHAYAWLVIAAHNYRHVIAMVGKGIVSNQDQKEITETEQFASELATVVDPITSVFAYNHLSGMTEVLKKIRSELTTEQWEETKRLAIQFRSKYKVAKFSKKELPSADDDLLMSEIFHE